MLAGGGILLAFVLLGVMSGRGEREQGLDLAGPLPGYPPCEGFVPDREGKRVEGAILPSSAVITRVRSEGRSRTATGFVPLRPVQIHEYYRTLSGIEVLQIEDEIIEAEALLTDGEFRMYIKATAVCDNGSEFEALVAPEQDAGHLPTPGGLPST